MSYCDYNPRLFKEFISMKTKIKPTLSSTWTLKAEQYRKLESCTLSNEEGIKIADISIKRLLQLMKEQNVSLIGDKLQGTFIIGNDRSLYTEEMYNTWKDKFEERISTEIPLAELVEGNMYRTVCGSTLVYLGKRWFINANLKNERFKMSKPTCNHFCFANYNANSSYGRKATKLNQKVIEDLGPLSPAKLFNWEKKQLEDAQNNGFSSGGTTLMYMSKEKPDMDNMVFTYEDAKQLFAGAYYGYRIVQKDGKMYFATGTGYYGTRYRTMEIPENTFEFVIHSTEVNENKIKGLKTFRMLLSPKSKKV